ncbi:uncharacterized protein LOC114131189 isoform X1 [Aphis gossypii]|uniref:uncharacterized protein LOC114131189 isoform X1 n=1 Tax=Aphis gossypii TaxID=80765 RepID=UPI002158FB53|nr:uncharacterized protein LOC114131189 isoform X1 [Aphis gossypii]
MMASRCLLNGFLVIALTMAVLVHNATGTLASKSNDEGGGGGGDGGAIVGSEGTTLLPSLMDQVTDWMDSFKQQASETLDEAGSAASVLSRLRPGTNKQTSELGGNGLRASKKKLPSGDNTLVRLQETKGRTMAAAKKVVDETIHKPETTVSDIRRTIIGDDWDDVGGNRRISSSLDGLFRPWAWRSRRSLRRGPLRRVEKRIEVVVEPRIEVMVPPRRGEEVHPWREKKVHPWREEEVPPRREVDVDQSNEMEFDKWRNMRFILPGSEEEVHPVHTWRQEEVEKRRDIEIPPRRKVDYDKWEEMFDKWRNMMFIPPRSEVVVPPRSEEKVHPWKKEEVLPKSEEEVHPWRKEEVLQMHPRQGIATAIQATA